MSTSNLWFLHWQLNRKLLYELQDEILITGCCNERIQIYISNDIEKKNIKTRNMMKKGKAREAVQEKHTPT